MNNLTKALMEELTVEYVKVGPLQIPESVVISWVILAIVTIGSILLTRNLKVDHISKRQAVLEMAVTSQVPISLKVCWAKRAGAMCLT